MREIRLREAAERCVVLPRPNREQLRLIFERFEAETFGFRAGAAVTVRRRRARRRPFKAWSRRLSIGVYALFVFAPFCEPEDGWVTLLSESLWLSEVIRRVRPAVSTI